MKKASETQIGGSHYKDFAIQPGEFCQRNKLNMMESLVIKYVCRHGNKGGAVDIDKAIHCLQLLKEWEYSSLIVKTDKESPILKDETIQTVFHSSGLSKDCLDAIIAELQRAIGKHPYFPSDIIHAVSIMCEESGEAIRAALQFRYEGGKKEEVRKELIHTGAMVLRCLINLDNAK